MCRAAAGSGGYASQRLDRGMVRAGYIHLYMYLYLPIYVYIGLMDKKLRLAGTAAELRLAAARVNP